MTLVKMYSSLKKPECFDSLTGITCSFNQPISIWTNVECLSLIFRSHFVKFSKSYTSCPKLSDICLWLRMQLFKISNLWQKKDLTNLYHASKDRSKFWFLVLWSCYDFTYIQFDNLSFWLKKLLLIDLLTGRDFFEWLWIVHLPLFAFWFLWVSIVPYNDRLLLWYDSTFTICMIIEQSFHDQDS